MDVQEAVRELRRALGDTQQAFAQRLGLSIRAVANYEKDRQPDAKSLMLLARAARETDREDLVEQFAQRFRKEMNDPNAQMSLITDKEIALKEEIGRALILNNTPQWAEKELEKLIKSTKEWQNTQPDIPGAAPGLVRESIGKIVTHYENLLTELRRMNNRAHNLNTSDKGRSALQRHAGASNRGVKS
jgi:transcriptional regulator with XRE-family HTH domain